MLNPHWQTCKYGPHLNIVTFREVDGIDLSIPANGHESSWFDSLGHGICI